MEKAKEDVLFKRAERMLSSVSIDNVIFCFHDGKLKILLNKFKTYTKWMLVGGFVYINESVDDAAYRILSERTELDKVLLKQFHVFGETERVHPDESIELLKASGIEAYGDHWFMNRFVSVGYYTFVDYNKTKMLEDETEAGCWFCIEDIPSLYADHNQIITKALSSIRSQIFNMPIGYELLPEKFTMLELRTIYETILGRTLDRRNFQRRILNSGLVYKVDDIYRRQGVKPSTMFTFDTEKYKYALEHGLGGVED